MEIDVVGMKKAKITDLQYFMKFLPLNAQNWYDKNVFDVLTENSDSTMSLIVTNKSVENCISFVKIVLVIFVFICFLHSHHV